MVLSQRGSIHPFDCVIAHWIVDVNQTGGLSTGVLKAELFTHEPIPQRA